jgi:hypothetical protein
MVEHRKDRFEAPGAVCLPDNDCGRIKPIGGTRITDLLGHNNWQSSQLQASRLLDKTLLQKTMCDIVKATAREQRSVDPASAESGALLEISKWEPVMAQQSGPENSILVISYLSLRKAIGVLGVALPFVLPFGQILLHALGIQSSLHSPVIESSVSSYYYTDMRNIFVGSMCAIGIFLMSYRGYDHRDARAGRFAFVCAIGLALFPTSPLPDPTADQKLIGGVHLTFAALLFLTLAYFSLCLFTKTDPNKPPTRQKLKRNVVYSVSGYVMLACIALIVVAALPPIKAMVEQLTPRFWLEAIAIVAFGISWLTKGEAILKDQETPRAAPQTLAAGTK